MATHVEEQLAELAEISNHNCCPFCSVPVACPHHLIGINNNEVTRF